MHLRHIPRVLIASAVSSPAVTGLLRPTLLLPADFDREFTPAEARLVLKHELMHLKRGDLPLNAIMCVLMALHWFNPLLWIAFFKIRADREAACDAQVLSDATKDHRAEYGHALLKVETAFCPHGFSLGFVGIFQRGSALRSRIQSIASHRAPHPSMKTLVTICIVLMTFLGSTRAQQSKPDAQVPLIAIEMKIVEFNKATDWNLGGKLPAGEPATFSSSLLSPEELAVRLRELMKNESANTTSYPRMVAPDGKELMLRSVVNQPLKSEDGKVVDVPIGLICKITPTVSGESISLDIDINDSYLIDPTTGAAISQIKGDKANARSRVYKATQKAQPGQSCVIASRDDGKPQTKRPVLYIITPHVITPEKGGLPAGAHLTTDANNTVEATTPPTTEAIRTKLEKIIIPQMQFQSATVAECIEYLRAKSSTLDTTTPDPTARGVNILYRPGNQPSNAAITLDLKEIPLGEALRYVVELASLKMSIQPSAVVIAQSFPATAADSPAPKPATESPSSKIIIPSIEFRDATLAECINFIRIKSRELDPDKKGVNIILKPGGNETARITLSLKNVPLSEVLHYCAELTNHKLTSDAQTFFLTPVSTEVPANKGQASSPASLSPASAAEAKAAELRKARPQQYDFNKANLGDVLRFIATDAGINFFALPNDNPINQKLVTFSIRASPFEALESLCRANGAVLVFDQDRWFIRTADDPGQIGKTYVIPQALAVLDQDRAADDPEQIGKAYVLPQTRASVETILKDISSILDVGETKPVADKPQPSVLFKKEQNSVYVKATRLQHSWVAAYFQGLKSSAQSGNTK